MSKKKLNTITYKKKFYRISKERLETYITLLNGLLKHLEHKLEKEKMHTTSWEKIYVIYEQLIAIKNSMHVFKNIEDDIATCGEVANADYGWLQISDLDDYGFFAIEFPEMEEKIYENNDEKNK